MYRTGAGSRGSRLPFPPKFSPLKITFYVVTWNFVHGHNENAERRGDVGTPKTAKSPFSNCINPIVGDEMFNCYSNSSGGPLSFSTSGRVKKYG